MAISEMRFPKSATVQVDIGRGHKVPLTFQFQQVAPITGDDIYVRVEDTGLIRHAIMTNPRAREQQLTRFARGRLT